MDSKPSDQEESDSASSKSAENVPDPESDGSSSPPLSPRPVSPDKSPSPPLSDSEESDSSHSQEPEEQVEEEDVETFRNMMKKKKKRAKNNDTDERDETAADQLLKEMEIAAKADEQANLEKRPAINKLKLLDKVLRFMKVGRFKDLFIQMNGACILQMWLKWLPDQSFPHGKIVQGILRAMAEMDIPQDQLEPYGLETCVRTLEQYHSDPEVRKLSRSLLDKWVREKFNIDTKWSSLEKFDDVDTRDYADRTAPETNLHKLIQQDQPTDFIRIPLKNQFDFKRRPQSKYLSNGAIESKASGSSLSKKLKAAARQKPKKQVGKMSADGKGIVL